LLLDETGGVRVARRQMIAIPVGAPRNSFGNMARSYVNTMRQNRKDYFLATIHGKTGLWKRLGRGRVKLMAYMKRTEQYTAKRHYHDKVFAILNRDAEKIFDMWCGALSLPHANEQ
jgi:hypothetical protein